MAGGLAVRCVRARKGLVQDQIAPRGRAALEKGIVDVAAEVVVESESSITHTEMGRHGQQPVRSPGWDSEPLDGAPKSRFAAN